MSEHLAGWADSAGHWLLAWTVVVAAVAALFAVCRPRRASVRYGGWLLATFSGVGLPLVVLTVSPVVTWKELAARFGWPPSVQEGNLMEDLSFRFETDASRRVASRSLGVGGEPSAVTSVKEPVALDQPMPSSTSATSAAAEPDASGTSAVTEPDQSGFSVTSAAFWAWLAGVCFFLGRLARRCWLARRLIRHSLEPISRETNDTYQAMRQRLGMVRDVRLAAHHEITTPVCVGAIRPVILWPAADNDRFNRRERVAAMAHELAHLRRYDEWVNLAAEFWRALTWFFPPVHWTIARFRREQEFLCDDLAARELDSPADYAQMLLKLTPVRLGPNVLCFTIGRGFGASGRVRRLINPEMRCVLPPSRVQMILLAFLALSLVAGAGSLRLIGFSNRTIAVAASTEPDTTAGLETRAESPAAETADDKPTDGASKKESPRPQILEVYPSDGASGVPPDTEIRIRFDRPMAPYRSYIQWTHESEGGFRPRGESRYLEETREFVLPVRLTPGCSHHVEINQESYLEEGEYMGFSSADQVAAKTYSWSFTTAGSPTAPDGRRPEVVAVDPPSNSEIPLLTLLKVKFDQPMDPTWYGLADQEGRGGIMDKPNLHHFVEYDPENHEFTLPLKLPGNWNGKIQLVHFRRRDGVEATPITLNYHTMRQTTGPNPHDRAAVAGESAQLVALIDRIRAARVELTSISEEICFAITSGSKPSWLDRYESTGATFKTQGDRRFVANIDQIMRIPFRVGSDGTSCWLRLKDEVFSCPFEEVAEKNVLFADPFRAQTPDDTASVIRDMKLEYIGQVMLEGRPCHRIRSWDVKLWSEHFHLLTPVRDWYIDGESLLPVRIDRDGVFQCAFHNIRVNEPIPDEQFQPETGQGIQIQEPEPLDDDYTVRYLNVIDGSNGRMSVRWGKKGPKGRSSSGLN